MSVPADRGDADAAAELLDRLVAVVVQHDERDRGLVPRGRPQRLDGVHAGPVAQEADDALARAGQRAADRERHAPAERAASRGEVAARPADRQPGVQHLPVARRLLHHDGVLGQQLVQGREDQRGLDGIGDRRRGRAYAGSGRLAVGLVDEFQQGVHARADRGEHARADRGPGRLRRVAVEVEELRALRQERSIGVDVVGEDRRADRDDHVVAVERAGQLVAYGRQEAAEQPVVLGKARPAGQRAQPDRRRGPLGEADDGRQRGVVVHAGADDQSRAAGAVERLRQLAGTRPARRRSPYGPRGRSTGSAGCAQSSSGTEMNTGPRGGVIATR